MTAGPGTALEPARAAPEDRGRTVIRDRVVSSIATKAVDEVDHAGGAARRVLGLSLGSDGEDSSARVEADVDGSLVSVRVSMAVTWPRSIRAVTREVRDHVTERVQGLTGLRVAEVDISVAALSTAHAQPARVV